jgi:hypothetical protein
MNPDLAFRLMCVGLAVLVVGLIVYNVLLRLKGKVQVVLERNQYHPGETITGWVYLNPRRTVTIDKIVLSVAAVQRTPGGRRRRGHSPQKVEIYRADLELPVSGDHAPDETHSFEFELVTPDPDNLDTGGAVETAVHVVRNTALGMAKGTLGGPVRWSIRARIHATGIDLFGKKSFEIFGN